MVPGPARRRRSRMRRRISLADSGRSGCCRRRILPAGCVVQACRRLDPATVGLPRQVGGQPVFESVAGTLGDHEMRKFEQFAATSARSAAPGNCRRRPATPQARAGRSQRAARARYRWCRTVRRAAVRDGRARGPARYRWPAPASRRAAVHRRGSAPLCGGSAAGIRCTSRRQRIARMPGDGQVAVVDRVEGAAVEDVQRLAHASSDAARGSATASRTRSSTCQASPAARPLAMRSTRPTSTSESIPMRRGMPLQRAPVHRLLGVPDPLRLELGRQVAAARLHPRQRCDALQLHHHHAHQRVHRLALARKPASMRAACAPCPFKAASIRRKTS